MSNTLLTIQMITNEALAVLENELTFTKNVNRQYDDSFGRSGAKIGTTLNVRKPVQYLGRTGQAVNIENTVESYVPLTLTTQRGVDFQFSSSELALSLDDFSERVIRPAIVNIANNIDNDGLSIATLATANVVGTPGTALSDAQQLINAGVKLDNNATPRGSMRAAVLSAGQTGNVVYGLKSIFNDVPSISEQYKTGNLGKLYGYKTSMDQNTQNLTIGSYAGTPVVSGASQTGNSLVTSGWTASIANLLNVGDVFTIAGVFAVNPVSRSVIANTLQQFVVTAAASSNGSGQSTLQIYPAITPTGQYQNVSNSPANSAAITVYGAPGTVTSQGLAFHRDAFTLACADLDLPGGQDMAARKSDPQTGLSIRFIRQYNVSTDQWISRFDILYGWAALRPEWACRIAS